MVTALQSGWRPCRDGELRQFVERLSVRRRLRLVWAASCLTALMVGTGVMATEAAVRLYAATGSEGLHRGGCLTMPTPAPRASTSSASMP